MGTEEWAFYSKFMKDSLGRLLKEWAKVLSALWGWIIRGYGAAGSHVRSLIMVGGDVSRTRVAAT